MESFDYIVVGGGSAGCAVAYQLTKANVGTVALLEAGYTNRVPQVKIPFGLVWTRGSKRDWRFLSKPSSELGGRQIGVTRGKMLGGSSSINSMVWFRGRRDDFDNWGVKNWRFEDLESDFEAVEALLQPQRFPDPHPLSQAYALALGDNGNAAPTPERESAGIFNVNLHNGARWSAADAFLSPAKATGRITVKTQANVDRITGLMGEDAKQVHLIDGRVIEARKAVILSAGSIGSPAILQRSGIGDAAHLNSLGIEVVRDCPAIGANLHDHPAIGLHYAGANSGYGLALNQLPHWALAPFNWLLRREGRFASQIVEAGAFFRADPLGPDGDARPDCQSHFIPFKVGHGKNFITLGSGYSADANICRPHSRGSLKIKSKDPEIAPEIDLGLLSDQRDVTTLINAVKRLREIIARAPFEGRRAPEVYPGPEVQTDQEIEQFVRDRCATAYHPVGTVRMGDDDAAPVDHRLAVRGVDGLYVADASIMPAVTTANTNAPSMMIGYRAGRFIVGNI